MTTIKEKIENDLQASFTAQDAETLRVLRYTMGVIQFEEKKREVGAWGSDEEVQAVISELVSKSKKNIAAYTQNGETERLAEATSEVAILKNYLPQAEELTEDALRAIVAETIAGLGDNVRAGQAIGLVIKKVKGQTENRLVQQLVNEALGG